MTFLFQDLRMLLKPHFSSTLNWLVVSKIFYFHPENWGRFLFWRAYFSTGLVQPPTSEIPSWIFSEPANFPTLKGPSIFVWKARWYELWRATTELVSSCLSTCIQAPKKNRRNPGRLQKKRRRSPVPQSFFQVWKYESGKNEEKWREHVFGKIKSSFCLRNSAGAWPFQRLLDHLQDSVFFFFFWGEGGKLGFLFMYSWNSMDHLFENGWMDMVISKHFLCTDFWSIQLIANHLQMACFRFQAYLDVPGS